MKYKFEYRKINNCIGCPMCDAKGYHTHGLLCKAETPYKKIKIKKEQTPPNWCRLEKVKEQEQ